MNELKMKSRKEIELQNVLNKRLRMKSQQQIMYEFVKKRMNKATGELKEELQGILNYFDEYIL